MAEITNEVYDIVYPSPIPLRDLSSIAVAIELWRLQVNQYRKKNNFQQNLYELRRPKSRLSLRDIIPNVPTVIERITKKYLKRLVASTNGWLLYHYDSILCFHRYNQNVILKDFDDIACDYDGTIDYVRTAKRMMLCDRISQNEKFKIACAYSFEEDIRRIGPSVQSKVKLGEINYKKCPPLHYWVRCIRNELDKIPNVGNVPIDDLVLKDTPFKYRSSIDYFWNLAGLESRYEKAVRLSVDDGMSFCGRFVLPKLNEEQLATFVAEQGSDLVYYLWSEPERKELVLAVWMYIKDKVDESNFITLVERMLSDETEKYNIDIPSIEKTNYDRRYHDTKILTTCCEIWASTADDLKRSAIEKLLTSKWLFAKPTHDLREHREIRFLMTVLLDATPKDRSIFWSNNWLHLLGSTRTTDLQLMMKLCLGSEDEIILFKNNRMAKHENLDKIAKKFLKRGCFKELTKVLNFISMEDGQTRRTLQRQCLQENFLSEYNGLRVDIFCESDSLHEFIDDAYADDADLAKVFRNEFLSSRGTDYRLLCSTRSGYYHLVHGFVDSFASRGHDVEPLKKRFVNELRDYMIVGRVCSIEGDGLRTFLLWCLGSDDRVTQFKQSISPDEILSNMVVNGKSSQENENNDEGLLAYPRNLDGFLTWYFDTTEEMNEFRTRNKDVFKMFAPPSR